MNKQTAGKWEVELHSHADGEQWLTVLRGAWDITHNGGKGAIADCRYSAMTDEENLANARLIAAAPEMAEALECVVENYDDGYIVGHLSVMKQIRAALKKARGE